MSIFPIDSVFPNTISAQSSVKSARQHHKNEEAEKSKVSDASTAASDKKPEIEPETSQDKELTRQEQQQAQELAKRDREVRAHESAHKAAGGSLTGPANFKYETGPDGRRYAVGGEVSIDTSEVPNDPEATLTKAGKIRAAALAPAQPSTQDRMVAAEASAMANDARTEILTEKLKADKSVNTDNAGQGGSSNDKPTELSESNHPIDDSRAKLKQVETYQQTAAYPGNVSLHSSAGINLVV